jgi:hypothetical protein
MWHLPRPPPGAPPAGRERSKAPPLAPPPGEAPRERVGHAHHPGGGVSEAAGERGLLTLALLLLAGGGKGFDGLSCPRSPLAQTSRRHLDCVKNARALPRKVKLRRNPGGPFGLKGSLHRFDFSVRETPSVHA